MEGARYTIEQLLALRESPLVRKPDELPSIDQWIESTQQAQQETQTQQRKPRNQSQRPEDPSPMGNFSSQRPSLLQTRHASRTSAQGDDIVLGPPKTSFASSRNLSKLEDREEDETPTTNPRSRFFRDRENNKTNTKDWHSARNSRLQDDDDAPTPRQQRGDRENGSGSGFGQRLDQRWTRDGDRDRDRPSQRGGWREREKQRNDRPDIQEKDPEWMDEPLEKENKNQMRTQQDFERWKERMKAGNTANAEAKDDSPPEEIATPIKTKPQTPLVTEPGFDKLFGSWAETKRLESPVEPRPAKPQAPSKAKSSRFASMFVPKDEPRPAPEESASPVPMTHASNGSSEDKEGFARIMAMLGGTPRLERDQDFSPLPRDPLAAMFGKKSSAAQSPRPLSGFSGDPFMPPPPQPQPQQHEKQQPNFPHNLGSHPASNVASPDPIRMRSEASASQLPHQMQSIFLDQPPRSSATPDSLNIQSIISGQQPRKTNSLNKDSEFLLNLIQAKNANRPPLQPRPQNEPDNFQLFLDQPPKMQTAAPKPQAPRPQESIEDQLFRQGQPQLPQNIDHHRQRVPPGFYEDPSIVVQQAQRSYPNEPPQARRQSTATNLPVGPSNAGPGAPQDFPPNFPFMSGPPPGANERLPPPPPGFNPNIRHPPGFANIPNIFQQPTAQPPLQHQQAAAMQGPPPGFGMPPPGMAMQGPPPPGFFGGPNHVPGVPPGFAPPGMMMMMGGGGNGIRSPVEGTPGLRSPQEGPGHQGMGMPLLQGMGAGYGRR